MTAIQAAERQASHECLQQELVAALELFVKQWNACGPNSDFGRYFRNVRDVAVTALAKASNQ